MRLPWIKLVVALVVVWLVAGGIIFWARSVKPTPEKLVRYLDAHPVTGASARDEASMVDKVAAQLNQLTYEQRREMRMSKKLDTFFRSLAPDQRSRFLDLTLPAGFKQMMDSLNKMSHEKRKEFVDKALADMRKHQDDEIAPEQRQFDANSEKIVNQGFKSFYSDASAETKMDMAPLIEQFQRNMEGTR
jgi:preprotein translocase subunit SecA